MTLGDTILVNYGGFKANSLCKIIWLGEYNDDHDHLKVIRHSPYIENDKLSDLLFSKNNSFTILSTNIESINAKFYEQNLFLKDYLKTNGFPFSAICIQESWLSENDDNNIISLFHLSN